MQTIDPERLDQDLTYRFRFLADVMGFGDADVALIHAAREALVPRIPGLVEAVYEKLFAYDLTKRHFLVAQHGYAGPLPETLAELTLDHPLIAFRKEHLAIYLRKLVSDAYEPTLVGYFDAVGKIHTAAHGNPDMVIPLVEINALMGFVADALAATIFDLPLDDQLGTLRAINKILWIQNDLFARHQVAR